MSDENKVADHISADLRNREDLSQSNTINLNPNITGDHNSTNLNVSFSTISRQLRNLPFWVYVILAIVVVILALALVQRRQADEKAGNLFTASLQSGIQSGGQDFDIAVNDMIMTLPNNILSENGPDQWSLFSRIWRRSADTLERAYSQAANCLRSGECTVKEDARDGCSLIVRLARWNRGIYSIVNEIGGISIDETGSGSPMPLPTGVGEVSIPDLMNLFYLAEACQDALGEFPQ